MRIVYVRGGDKTAPNVAKQSGMDYGIRHDYAAYGDVYMLDVNWKKFDNQPMETRQRNWLTYMEKVKEHRPLMALVPDYTITITRAELYRYIRDVKPYVAHVLVCPKQQDIIHHIPSWCIIAISVPAPSYAGFLPDFRHLVGRKIHLLGGRPEKQAEIIQKLLGVGCEIVSVDGSYHARKAGLGQWFTEGSWTQLRGKNVPDTELAIGSGQNIVRYLKAAAGWKQPMLL